MSTNVPTLMFEQGSHWEELHASKEQLQSFGIGTGLAFPGEGKAAKVVRTADPRGYSTRIERAEGSHFRALISYPRAESSRTNFTAPHIDGLVPEDDSYPHGDCYTGTAAAIVAAGLARLDQIPGQPGAAKGRVCILPDGSVCKAGSDRRRDTPGAVLITLKGKTLFRIVVNTSELENKRRSMTWRNAYVLDQYQQSRMPQPAILLAVYRELKRLAAVEQEAQAPDNLQNGFWVRTTGGA